MRIEFMVDSALRCLRQALDRIHQMELKLKPSKCILGCPSSNFLGHVASANAITSQPPRTLKAIAAIPPPQDFDGMRAFLRLASYYCQEVPQFAQIVKLSHDLKKQNKKTTRLSTI
ncbi:hypothetical protein Pcinc_012373 [Petrolisthes cinctipes]|uniref:Uncharacterized protein n=1 Tax=Petrolisthes cinctipes TaxID=88211 RepID=A0AAE1G210_PETCI|nr:hypothetical protein Pcinc_012373 [Petrolisthes cinctipes]